MQSQQKKIQNHLILNFCQPFRFRNESRTKRFTLRQRQILRPVSVFNLHPRRLFLDSFESSRVFASPNGGTSRFYSKPTLLKTNSFFSGRDMLNSNVAFSLNKSIGCKNKVSFLKSFCTKKSLFFQKSYSNPAFKESVYSPLIQFKVPDFLNIQRLSFRHFLNEGLITEFKKYNSIYNSNQTFEVFFYAEHYKVNRPKWTPKQAILKRKSYSCQLYLPVQISNHLTEESQIQWVLLANLPLMTKHGHFILNGCPRVLMNQMVRSPGVYFQKIEKKNNKMIYCADFIAQRGSWLRLEVDTKKGDIWAKLKKTPKIPIFVLLRALGLSLPVLNNSIDFGKLRYLLQFKKESKNRKKIKKFLLQQPGLNNSWEVNELRLVFKNLQKYMVKKAPKKQAKFSLKTAREAKTWETPFACETYFESLLELCKHIYPQKTLFELDPLQAQRFLFRKFQNSRSYDLSILGRLRINQKLGLCIPPEHTTLTAQDIFVACLFLMDLLQGLVISDDIDDLKNRKIKPSGELVQTQLATGLGRLDKIVREKLKQSQLDSNFFSNLFTVKPLNQSFREFFGTSPLSQLMDQTNALSELTHKRRLSSLGPGGINRETAGMAIRGIHPTHYGRICPIETPEGQNAGLVNSFTIYSHLNTKGFIETPFYKTYKGFVFKNKNPFLFSSDQENSWVLAPGDIKTSLFNFLPSGLLPSRQLKEFKRVSRNEISFTSMSPIQMISVATSLIPFLEHNDGNRALMGSNMQRQAVPTIRPSKPIVGTGLESRVISDVGHGLQVQSSGFVSYVDGKRIVVYSKLALNCLKTTGSQTQQKEFLSTPHKVNYLGSRHSKTAMPKKFLTKPKSAENRYFFKKYLSGALNPQLSLPNLTTENQLLNLESQKQFIFKLNTNVPFNEKLDSKLVKKIFEFLPLKKNRKLQIFSTPFALNWTPKLIQKSLTFKKNLVSAKTTDVQRQTEYFSEKLTYFNPQGGSNSDFQVYLKQELKNSSETLEKYFDPFLSISPFQTNPTKNNFSTKQQAFFYRKLFLNDFLGQLELTTLFSKTIVYSKFSKNFKPFFSNRSFILINQFSHPKLLKVYCQLILVHFYKKFSLQKENLLLEQSLKKFPFEKILRKYEKPFFSKETTTKNFQSHKSQKENPFWYKPFLTFNSKTLIDLKRENGFVRETSPYSGSFTSSGKLFKKATFDHRGERILLFKKGVFKTVKELKTSSNLLSPFLLNAGLINEKFAPNQIIKKKQIPAKNSRFLVWCQNFCKRALESELHNYDPNKLLSFYPSENSKSLVKKATSVLASLNSGSLPQSKNQTFEEVFYPNFCAKKDFLSKVFLRSASINSLTKSSFFRKKSSQFVLKQFEGTTKKNLNQTQVYQATLEPKLKKTSKEFLKYFLKFDPAEPRNFKKYLRNSWNLSASRKQTFTSKIGPSFNSFSSKEILNKTSFKLSFGNQTKKSENFSMPSNLSPLVYNLNNYHRSNQDTYMVHRPVVHEGQWVEKGDILADSSASVQGELAIGQNILVGYTPWEGYNFEDAVLISERLIYDDLYTSLHIERYEVEVRDTQYGMEQITNQIPNKPSNCNYIDYHGIAKVGTWVEEGDILVGKIAPLGQKKLTPYENLLYDILGKEVPKTRDTSLRVPKGASGRVLHVEIVETDQKRFSTSGSLTNLFAAPRNKIEKPTRLALLSKKSSDFQNYFSFQTKIRQKPFQKIKAEPHGKPILSSLKPIKKTIPTATQRIWNKEMELFTKNEKLHQSILKRKLSGLPNLMQNNQNSQLNHQTVNPVGFSVSNFSPGGLSKQTSLSFDKILKKRLSVLKIAGLKASNHAILDDSRSLTSKGKFEISNQPLKKFSKKFSYKDSKLPRKGIDENSLDHSTKTPQKEIGPNLPVGFSGPKKVHIYLAEKRKLQLGDKIAGRHGNKGIISNILPRQDMPYLPDGTPLDIVLNPLGVPSRMNVGQIFECLLGIAGYYLKQNYKIQPFDEIYGCEASRSLVYSKLYEARIKTGQDWLFNPNFPGKIRLFDGRTGECFEQPVTVGVAYILKLVHLVDDKIHARSTGPYSLVTQQPLRGRSKQGGQRVGEMEVWALEGFGAAYILQEILTIKSDDLKGRNQVMESILNNQPFHFGLPESFKVLIRELQSLCLDIAIFKYRENQAPTKINISKF